MKKGIITVIGKDTVGIIAKTCTYLADHNINILDISQTIVEDYFNMMMIVDLTSNMESIEEHVDNLAKLGESIGVIIKLQLEDIFNEMHRI
ncbi:MAG: ACT domain-containing protein [Firmicutes bacterium HGW-Firmicutes-2]|jgi:ACT domain-containing protein|nr:MAG: ACT domain-containing protein [Firmicutes bacterium HGW-Firmicutes-2]